MNQQRMYWLCFFAFFYPLIALSEDIEDTDDKTPSYYQIEVGGGWSFFKSSNQEALNVALGEVDLLHQTSQSQFIPFHVGVSRTFILSPYTFISIGPHIYYQQARWSGDVYQFSNPLLNNYLYRIRNNLWSFLLEGRWEIEAFDNKRIHPYLFGGIGLGVTTVSYTEVPKLNVPTRIIPNTNGSGNKLAWNAGVGVDVDLSTKISLGVKYVFYLNNGHHPGQRSASIGDFPLAGSMRFSTNAPCVFLNLTYKFVEDSMLESSNRQFNTYNEKTRINTI